MAMVCSPKGVNVETAAMVANAGRGQPPARPLVKGDSYFTLGGGGWTAHAECPAPGVRKKAHEPAFPESDGIMTNTLPMQRTQPNPPQPVNPRQSGGLQHFCARCGCSRCRDTVAHDARK
jgi:hypothetical protein